MPGICGVVPAGKENKGGEGQKKKHVADAVDPVLGQGTKTVVKHIDPHMALFPPGPRQAQHNKCGVHIEDAVLGRQTASIEQAAKRDNQALYQNHEQNQAGGGLARISDDLVQNIAQKKEFASRGRAL